jgi:hypothetical protein
MKIISIEGNIGSGKSTILNCLKEKSKINTSLIFLLEPVDEWEKITDTDGTNILTRYYSDQKRYAFSFQMMAFITRLRQINEIIEKYTENVATIDDNDGATYLFTPDVDPGDSIRDPYMDRLGIRKMPYIGKNTKSLYLNRLNDWSKCRIAPDAKIKELVIETTDIPEDLFKINLSPEWIKFKYLTINTLENFSKIKTDSLAFDKCKFDTKVFNDVNSANPDISKLQIISCDLTGDMNLSQFKKLEELHVIYTIDSLEELKDLTENLSIKKLVLSGDLIKDKSSKEYIQVIRKQGIKVEIVGPVI